MKNETSNTSDIADRIADCLFEDHIDMMKENADLQNKTAFLNRAMLMLAKLKDDRYYPKGGYSSDIMDEWDELLNQWFGEVRPYFK